MKTKKYDTLFFPSKKEKAIYEKFVTLFRASPLPDDEVLSNLGLFITSKNLARILFYYEIYKKILCKHGIIVEFGVRWGQTLSIMSALRGMLEPYNRRRKIVGFDTFKGWKGMGKKDGKASGCKDGSWSVSINYENYLNEILSMQEELNPISHLKKFEIVKGDAIKTVPIYLKNHPETIISLALFDFDLYKPTKIVLKAIKPYLCSGSIIVFDDLCEKAHPGETVALSEVFGLKNIKIQRHLISGRVSYLEMK